VFFIHNSKKGMTLVEIVVVMALLAIILTAAAVIFIPALKSTNQTNEIASARAVADTTIDYIKDQVIYADPVEVTGSAGSEADIYYLYIDENGHLVKKSGGTATEVFNQGFYSGLELQAADDHIFTVTLASNLQINIDVIGTPTGDTIYSASYTLELLNNTGETVGISGDCIRYGLPDYVD